MAKKLDKLAEQDRLTDTYNSKVKEYGGDKTRAMTETFTTEACLDGSLHETFDEKINIYLFWINKFGLSILYIYEVCGWKPKGSGK
jgi:hypothetical protein